MLKIDSVKTKGLLFLKICESAWRIRALLGNIRNIKVKLMVYWKLNVKTIFFLGIRIKENLTVIVNIVGCIHTCESIWRHTTLILHTPSTYKVWFTAYTDKSLRVPRLTGNTLNTIAILARRCLIITLSTNSTFIFVTSFHRLTCGKIYSKL